MKLSLQITHTSKQLLGLVLIVVGIFLLERVGWAQQLQQRTMQLLQPVEYLGIKTATVLEFPFYLIEQERQTAAEIQELKRSYAQTLARLSELEAIEKENEALRTLVSESGTSTKKKKLAAPVLSYSLTAIALGSEDSVQEGALVYISDVLMGRVTTVSKTQSQVTLFSARDSEPVLVKTEAGVQGLLVGTGKRVELTQVPIQTVINPGERLTTVGQPGIPPEQFVGVVASVSQPATAPMQTAVVDQLESFYSTSLVEVR